jgi:hypothetical protein
MIDIPPSSPLCVSLRYSYTHCAQERQREIDRGHVCVSPHRDTCREREREGVCGHGGMTQHQHQHQHHPETETERGWMNKKIHLSMPSSSSSEDTAAISQVSRKHHSLRGEDVSTHLTNRDVSSPHHSHPISSHTHTHHRHAQRSHSLSPAQVDSITRPPILSRRLSLVNWHS